MKNNLKSKQLKNRSIWKQVWFVFVLLIFIKPAIIDDIPSIDLFFNIFKVSLSLVYLGLVIIDKQIDKNFGYLTIIFAIVLILTLINGGEIEKALSHYFVALGLVSFVRTYYEDIDDIINILIIISLLLLGLNLLTYFLTPNGIYCRAESNVKVWLLGQKQDLPGFIFPAVFLALVKKLKYNNNKSNKQFIFMFTLTFVTVLLEQSIAAMICLVIFGILCLGDKYFRLRFGAKTLIIISAAIFIMLQYISYNFDELPILRSILNGVSTDGSNKVRNMATRFSMWQFAWENFAAHPLTGVGELSRKYWISKMGFYHSIVDNMFMDVIMASGIIGTALFLKNITDAYRSLAKYSQYCIYLLFSICIYMFFGSPFSPLMFLIFLIPVWIDAYMKERTAYEPTIS